MDFVDDGQIVPLALRRTHRANAGAKRKQAEEESSKAKDKQKELKKKRKRHSAPPNVASNPPKAVTKLAADFIRSSKTKSPVPRVIKNLHPHNDFYCWLCHNQRNDGNFLYCNICPRVYHDSCANLKCPQPDWVCFECEKITDAECTETQSSAMASLTVDKLAKVLRTAIEKMKRYTNSLLFTPIDDLREFRDYRQFVYHPMDLSVIEKNVQERCYGSTEAFLADARWIVHNAFVYFGSGNRYSTAAKSFLKACETEMSEVELCPECYLNAVHKRDHWFAEVCTKAHPLVWAKLHGFPFWPAKAMREADGLIEARFFGQHDRAMIPVHNCFQYSTKIPFPASKKRLTGLNAAIKEVEIHIQKLEEKNGMTYKYAPHLTPYDPNKRYTTSSLAVMPDGQVKSLTGKMLENGKEGSPKRGESSNKSMKENVKPVKEDENEDVDVETGSVEIKKEPEDADEKGSGNLEEEGKDESMDLSVASSADIEEADEEGKSSGIDGKDFPTCVQEHDHSYASPARSKSMDGPGGENVEEQDDDSDEDALSDEDDDENDDEESIINERKRKLSDTPTDQPNKLARTSSVGDGAVLDVTPESVGKDDKVLNALTADDATNEADSPLPNGKAPSQSKDSADPKTLAAAKDSLRILLTRLPNLDDLEASINSSESSSSIPEDDAKSNSSTPKKDTFLLNLSKTIDTCKASLGIDEEMEEEEGGGKDDAEGLEDADTTGDESMESEEDDNEGAENGEEQSTSTSSKGSDGQDRIKDGQPAEGQFVPKEDGSEAVTQKKPEDLQDSAGASDLDGMETDNYGSDSQNYKMTKIQALVKDVTTEEETGDEEGDGKAKTEDERGSDPNTSATEASEMETESSTPKRAESQNVTQALPSKDETAETKSPTDDKDENDDDEDDDAECLDDFDDDDSSDGALLIDEGDDEPKNSEKKKDESKLESKSSTTDSFSAGAGVEAKSSTCPDYKKEEVTSKEQPQPNEKLTPSEDDKKETKDEDSDAKEEKSAGAEDRKVAELSKESEELVQGVPKTRKEDEDYQKLITKVVDDAVKSFKELDASLGDVSEDFKKLVLGLKREVISLKAKQELQQKELMHCNELAAAEIRQVMEYNRDQQLVNVRRKYDTEKGNAVFATKTKQWCASCFQEANYFCCWNTSYCGYTCQERHWTRHEKTCQQKSGNFPFLLGADYIKKRKKKKKKEIEKAWLKEYNIVDDESDEGDPNWEPDPEDLPTRVPREKSYSSSPHYIAQQQKPKIMNPIPSRTMNPQAPNRTWTQPGMQNNAPKLAQPSPTALQAARQRFQAQLMNAKAKAQQSQQIYIPGSSAQPNRITVASSTVGGPPPVIVKPAASNQPVRFLTCPKGTMPGKSPNVVYVGAPDNSMLTAMGLGVPAPGATNNMPLQLQVPSNKVSSLVQALGQPLQQGSKYVIQLAPGQQLASLPSQTNPNQPAPVVIQNMMGGIPQTQVAAGNTPVNPVQNIYPVGPKQIMTLPANGSQKPVVMSMQSVINTPASPVVAPATSLTISTATVPAAPTPPISIADDLQNSTSTPAMDTT